MIDKDIEKLLIKYLNRSSNVEELSLLNKWISNPKNEAHFDGYIKTHFEITLGMNKPDVDIIKKMLLKEIKYEKTFLFKLKTKSFYRLTAAAIVALLFSLPFVLKELTDNKKNKSTIVEELILPGSDKAVLTLEDGKQVALEKGQEYATDVISSNGERIIYKEKNKETIGEEVVYNYLTIPKGGQFFIQLSDSTKVWLNSDSKIKYPVNFIKGQTREVELLYGEAYFDVTSSSAKNNGSKFKVKALLQEVEVLGTEFNIKAYFDEEVAYTTLIEGSVNVSNKSSSTTLELGEQSIVTSSIEKIVIHKANIFDAIAWRQGVFSFKSMPLKNIMKVLGRWYDIKAEFENSDLENTLFTGILSKDQKLEEILSIITNSNNFKYEINRKTIIFK